MPIATYKDGNLLIEVYIAGEYIQVNINGSKVNATQTLLEKWKNMTKAQRSALLDYYVSIYRSY